MAGNDLGDLLGQFMQAMLEKQQRGNAERAEAARRGQSLPHAPSRPAQPPSGRPPLVAAEIVEAEPVTGDDVAEYVAQHLDSRRVTEHATHLGEDVARTDQQLASHQRELFGSGPRGRLGKSGPDKSATGEAPQVEQAQQNSIARDIAQLLQSPQELRSAFILGEVLRRPEW
ncbi:MAG: hypothetical protein U0935_07240 [Pirellulales bacterium]